MTDAPEPLPETRSEAAKQRRIWLTVGEVIAVAGLVLAGVNYWDSHHERTTAERERTAAEQRAKVQAEKASVMILRGTLDTKGETILIEPLKADQVIQSQRYYFPSSILANAKEIGAGRPQIDLVWFDKGLRRALKTLHKDGAAYPVGEAMLPVAVVTTYVEMGDLRSDTALYRVGYQADPGMLGALKLRLTGLSFTRRGLGGEVQAAVDAAWKAAAPQPQPKSETKE